jgi:Starch-binding associating with outer membrane
VSKLIFKNREMKRYLVILAVTTCFYSCVNEAINVDPNSAYTTLPETLVSNAQKELSDYTTTPNVNENNFRLTMQYWQETTYTNESVYDFANRKVSDQVWRDNYVNVLNNLSKAKELINAYSPSPSQVAAWPTKKKNQLAIIDVMMVYVYQNMVDTFGDIPYSQSLNLEQYSLPVYDKASTVYESLIARLNIDIANFAVGESFDSTEYFYKGDLTKWKKFSNSLLLKLGIALSDVNPSLAQTTVNKAIAGGVITDSADNCQLQYLPASPNYNPLFDNLSASGRNDFIACKTLVDYMNAKNDTRISKYFDPIGKVFVGQTVGEGGEFSEFSPPASFAYTEITPGIILNNTEVAFYLAEAAARWTPASAATAYNDAVKASFVQWGLTSADATTYLASNPYVATNWKKSIGEQAWVAMYNQANTAWNFYRRLDFPVLSAPANAIPNAKGKVPVRLQYPPKEQATNPTNWLAAGVAIGGDLLTTKIFWDKN